MKKTYLLILFLILVTSGFAYLKFQVLNTQAPITSDPRIVTPAANMNTTPTTSLAQSVSSGLTISLTTPADNSTASTSSLKLSGTTKPGAQVFVNDTELKADAKGGFSTTVTLNDGDNEIFLAANDDVGNYAEKSIVVNYVAQ